ncbi:MAG: electron transfer flavoprotein subunit alpha/FixB family protein [Clostridiaceae bacterium]
MSKNVFVFAEQRDGKLQKVGIELLGKASELAAALSQEVVAVLLGSGVTEKAKELIAYGASEVIVADHPLLGEYVTEPYAKAVAAILKKYKPEIMLFGATSIGRDLAPRVSARIHTGLTADCTGLAIEEDTKLLLMTRPAFGGNIMATIVCKEHRPQMATVRPGVMRALTRDETREGKITAFDARLTEADVNVRLIEVVKGEKRCADITEAKILVSGGRGVGAPEKFAMLRSLADALGGEVASSRACVDAGWMERDYQVGQTGKTVRPKLYVACGISGAIQHLAGMEGSDYIVAVNKNPAAPVFEAADLGIVGDVNAIVPKLTEAIKKFKEEKAR